MQPQAPAANPTTSNTNQAFGGFGQVQNDYATAGSILNNLPAQEAQSTANATNANTNTGSILPNISINAPTYSAPTAPVINPASYGTNETGYNAAVQTAEGNQISQENSTMGAAQGALSTAEQQFGNLTPVYQQLAGEYNIPGYQNDVATLSGLLQNLNQDVNTQTTLGGGAITGAARDEMYSNESNPLNLALSNASEFLNYGQNDVSNLLDTYEKTLGNELTPLETNISNLPGEFSQANSAAEAGYGQGATAIQNTISNAAEQKSLGLQAQYNAIQAAAEKAEYGTGEGNVGSVLGGANGQTSNSGATYGYKVANNPSSGYYFEGANGQPMNAIQYAQQTGVPAMNVISAMANSGDTGAKSVVDQVNGALRQKLITQDQVNDFITQNFGSF